MQYLIVILFHLHTCLKTAFTYSLLLFPWALMCFPIAVSVNEYEQDNGQTMHYELKIDRTYNAL